MSRAINDAILARLTSSEGLATYTGARAAQDRLWGLLDFDYDHNGVNLGPAVMHGNTSPVRRGNAVTYRKSSGVETLDGHDFGVRADVIYDFEYWTDSSDVNVIHDIDRNVELLLDNSFRVSPVLYLSSGFCFWADALTEMSTDYDDRLNQWFGLRRFRIVEARVDS